jgi:uncharacterized protein (DUF58 family)
VDASLSMDFGTPTKLHYAKQVAAALGFIGLVNLDRVVVQAFGERLKHTSPPLRGRRSLWQLLDFLEKVGPAGASDLARSMKDFTVRSSGKGVVVLLSDFMDKAGYEDGLRYLVARQMDVYAIQILSQEEIEPGVVGDLKLVDVEDADVAEVTVNGPLLKRYKQNLAAYRAALHQFCTRRGVACLFTSTEVPFDRLVLTYLRQRGLVR